MSVLEIFLSLWFVWESRYDWSSDTLIRFLYVGISIDGPSENLYWTDLEYGHIMVAKTDGSYAYKLLNNLGKPKAIAVHPRKMFVYLFNSYVLTKFRLIALKIHDIASKILAELLICTYAKAWLYIHVLKSALKA